MTYENEIMVKVAQLYHKERLKQESIASRRKISKNKVNRVLGEAGSKGIIKFKIIETKCAINND